MDKNENNTNSSSSGSEYSLNTVNSTQKDDESSAKMVTTYADDIFATLRSNELRRYRLNFNSPQLWARPHLLQLIRKIHTKCKQSRITYHLAIYILDFYMDLELVEIKDIPLLGIACLLIAAKMEDGDKLVPRLQTLNEYVESDYTLDAYRDMERRVLFFTHFDMLRPTIATFAEHLSADFFTLADYTQYTQLCMYRVTEYGADSALPHFGCYTDMLEKLQLMLFALVDATVELISLSNERPSDLAAGCIYMVRYMRQIFPVWNAYLEQITGCNEVTASSYLKLLTHLYDAYVPRYIKEIFQANSSSNTTDSGVECLFDTSANSNNNYATAANNNADAANATQTLWGECLGMTTLSPINVGDIDDLEYITSADDTLPANQLTQFSVDSAITSYATSNPHNQYLPEFYAVHDMAADNNSAAGSLLLNGVEDVARPIGYSSDLNLNLQRTTTNTSAAPAAVRGLPHFAMRYATGNTTTISSDSDDDIRFIGTATGATAATAALPYTFKTITSDSEDELAVMGKAANKKLRPTIDSYYTSSNYAYNDEPKVPGALPSMSSIVARGTKHARNGQAINYAEKVSAYGKYNASDDVAVAAAGNANHTSATYSTLDAHTARAIRAGGYFSESIERSAANIRMPPGSRNTGAAEANNFVRDESANSAQTQSGLSEIVKQNHHEVYNTQKQSYVSNAASDLPAVSTRATLVMNNKQCEYNSAGSTADAASSINGRSCMRSPPRKKFKPNDAMPNCI